MSSGWPVGWLVGCWVGWLVGWLVVWLVAQIGSSKLPIIACPPLSFPFLSTLTDPSLSILACSPSKSTSSAKISSVDMVVHNFKVADIFCSTLYPFKRFGGSQFWTSVASRLASLLKKGDWKGDMEGGRGSSQLVRKVPSVPGPSEPHLAARPANATYMHLLLTRNPIKHSPTVFPAFVPATAELLKIAPTKWLDGKVWRALGKASWKPTPSPPQTSITQLPFPHKPFNDPFNNLMLSWSSAASTSTSELR